MQQSETLLQLGKLKEEVDDFEVIAHSQTEQGGLSTAEAEEELSESNAVILEVETDS